MDHRLKNLEELRKVGERLPPGEDQEEIMNIWMVLKKSLITQKELDDACLKAIAPYRHALEIIVNAQRIHGGGVDEGRMLSAAIREAEKLLQ